jgi:hypothetical protein
MHLLHLVHLLHPRDIAVVGQRDTAPHTPEPAVMTNAVVVLIASFFLKMQM